MTTSLLVSSLDTDPDLLEQSIDEEVDDGNFSDDTAAVDLYGSDPGAVGREMRGCLSVLACDWPETP